MRIIAGASKGKNLFSPTGKTRPTSDRAREGLFSSLESEFGSMSELNFLDLFSGYGFRRCYCWCDGISVSWGISWCWC